MCACDDVTMLGDDAVIAVCMCPLWSCVHDRGDVLENITYAVCDARCVVLLGAESVCCRRPVQLQ